MTNQIHRIADKEPEFPARLRFKHNQVWRDFEAKPHPFTLPMAMFDAWSPVATAPEVRPDASPFSAEGNKIAAIRPKCEPLPPDCTHQPGAINPDPLVKDPATGRTFRPSEWQPSSTPSPAAIAAAREYLAPAETPDGQIPQEEDVQKLAAIIDKHFAARSPHAGKE